MFARSGGNGFDKQVRDQPLPQLQFKTAGSVRGRLHQVQARKYDHMLDIVHLERSALRPTKKTARRRLFIRSQSQFAAGFTNNCTPSAVSTFNTVPNAGSMSPRSDLYRPARSTFASSAMAPIPWARARLPSARIKAESSVASASLR